MSEIEKNIAFKIKQMFPEIYREQGPELVKLVEEYYKFQETETNQSVYNSRRMFDYKDISNTLTSMIMSFHKMFMADLPILDETTTRIVVKNIIGLYRRKGTPGGIEMFFRIFFKEEVSVSFPSKYMLKVSDSSWKTGTFLQMTPNSGVFQGRSQTYKYEDLINKTVTGSVTGATAVVDKISFTLLNKTIIPVILVNEVKGVFRKYDDIIARVNGEEVSFGRVNGSLDSIEIDVNYGGTSGNKVGDKRKVESPIGIDGECIVTSVQDVATGEVRYELLDGGFGYTINNTKLLVSDQVIVLDNPDFSFTPLERLRDTAGNEGIVIGQNTNAVGLRMNPGSAFDISRDISTLDRGASNITLTAYDVNTDTGDIFTIPAKNNSSPGALYPETGNISNVRVGSLSEAETIGLIVDNIADFLSVPLNSANFNAIPPATAAMSGTADPVTLATPLNQAFDLTPFEIGVIDLFYNISPGADYVNDVWALVRDEVMASFQRYEQTIIVENYSPIFAAGNIITQGSVRGLITSTDSANRAINVRPYAYYGFNATDAITYQGQVFNIVTAQRDYNSEIMGTNAEMLAKTVFADGRINSVRVTKSGLGYVEGETVYIVDDNGRRLARGTVSALTEGVSEGYWSELNSHLNGYTETLADDGEDKYFDSQMKIQDSDYYQEWSYVIDTTTNQEVFQEPLLNNVHLAGSKMFSRVNYKRKAGLKIKPRFLINRKDDYITGGDPVVGPGQIVGNTRLRVDTNLLTVDNTEISVDTTQ
jgi:hypothetical protein